MMQAAPLITEELLDEDFFAELDALIDKDFEGNKEIQEENRNCGTGAVGGKQGFQPGNKCAGTGEKSKGKAEGKKKNVHSDWDDGKTAAEAGWTHMADDDNESGFIIADGVSKDGTGSNEFQIKEPLYTNEPGVQSGTKYTKVELDSYDSGWATNSMSETVGYKNHAPNGLTFEVGYTTEKTGEGRAMEIIRQVSNRTISLFNDPNVAGLEFTAMKSDGIGRTKLYTSLAKRLAKKTDSKAWAVELNRDYAFVVSKAKSSKKVVDFFETFLPGRDLIPIDEFDPRRFKDEVPEWQ